MNLAIGEREGSLSLGELTLRGFPAMQTPSWGKGLLPLRAQNAWLVQLRKLRVPAVPEIDNQL